MIVFIKGLLTLTWDDSLKVRLFPLKWDNSLYSGMIFFTLGLFSLKWDYAL